MWVTGVQTCALPICRGHVACGFAGCFPHQQNLARWGPSIGSLPSVKGKSCWKTIVFVERHQKRVIGKSASLPSITSKNLSINICLCRASPNKYLSANPLLYREYPEKGIEKFMPLPRVVVSSRRHRVVISVAQ